jgi:hypothetical protein
LEGQDGDLRWAVEAEGKAHGADAAIDVELHLIELVGTLGIFFAHGGQNKRSQEGEPDLAAVGVAGEHEVDEGSARVLDDGIGVIGLMGEQDHRGVGFGWDGEIEVGVAGAGVFQAAEPKTGAVLLYSDVLVDQDGGAGAAESVDDHGSTDGDIVIAKDGVTERRGEGCDDLGAAMGGVPAGDEGERAVGDEVSGEQDKVGGKCVHLADDVFEKVGFGVLIKVDVAELHDAVAVEGAGQVGDGDGTVDDVDLVAGNLAGVEGHSCSDSTGADEEVASGKARRLIGLRTGHRP